MKNVFSEVISMSEQAFKPVNKKDALAWWNMHQRAAQHNSEGQMRRHHAKHVLAAKKIREGLTPKEIWRETGICTGTVQRVQKMIEKGEI